MWLILVGLYTAFKELLLSSGKIEVDLAHVNSSKIGNYEDEYYSHRALLSRLVKYRKLFRYNIRNTRDSAVASRLDTAIVDLETDRVDGTLRKQPYCIVLYGEPGTGKSSFAIQLANALITSRYGDFNSFDLVTLNETDEFQSEFRTSHKVVLFDDVSASSSSKPDTMNPWRKVIDFVNNVKKTALNPNCEMKGKVYIMPDLVILTTNRNFKSGEGQLKEWVPCYTALQRRFSQIICVDSFTHCSFVIPTSMKQSSLDESSCNSKPRTYAKQESIKREDILVRLISDFGRHMADQQIFIDTINSNFSDYPDVITPLDSQSGELTELPMGIPNRLHSHELTRTYYRSRIDLKHYFNTYRAPMGDDGCDYHLFGSRIVDYPVRGATSVDKDRFNEVYVTYLSTLGLSDDEFQKIWFNYPKLDWSRRT